MRKLSEDSLQRLLENGITTRESAALSEEDKNELQVYKHLFEVLKAEPEEGPSYSFSNKIRLRLQAEMDSKSTKRFYLSLGLIFFFCVAGILGVLMFIDSIYQIGLIRVISSGKWILIFSFSAFFVIQYADDKFLQSKFYKRKN